MTYVLVKVRKTRKPGIYKLSWQDESVLLCPDELLVTWQLRAGREVSSSEYKELCAQAERILARKAALDLVASSPLSKQGLLQKLRKKGFGPEACQGAVQRVQELGYIDDAAYAANLADSLQQQGKYGLRRIQEELVRRGVDRQLAKAVVSELDASDERHQALRIMQKAWRPTSPEKRDAALRRMISLLQRRGFDWSTIRWCLTQVVPEVDIHSDTE
jgi:regulatory protein